MHPEEKIRNGWPVGAHFLSIQIMVAHYGIFSILNQTALAVSSLVALAPAYYVFKWVVEPEETKASTIAFTRRVYNGANRAAVNLGLRRKATIFDGVLKQQPYGRPVEYQASGHLFYEKGFWAEIGSDFKTLLGFGDREKLLDKRLLRAYVKQKRAEDIPRPYPFLTFSDHVSGLEYLLREPLDHREVDKIRLTRKYFRWARFAAMIFPFSFIAGFI
jgi:hypothetical protein